jgi:hypothetical protein
VTARGIEVTTGDGPEAAAPASSRPAPPTAAADFILAVPFDLDIELDIEKLRARFETNPETGEPPLAGRNAPITVAESRGLAVTFGDEALAADAAEEVLIFGFEVGLLLIRFGLRRELTSLARLACLAEAIKVAGRQIYVYADERAAAVRKTLEPCARGRYEVSYRERDVYPIVVLAPGPDLGDAGAFLAANPGAILGIVAGEDQWERLSPFALSRSEVKNLGYYQDELIIAKEWGALISSRYEEKAILALVLLAYAQRWALQSYNHLTGFRQDRALRLLARAKQPRRVIFGGGDLRRIAAHLFEASEDRIALMNAIRDFTSVPELTQDWHLYNLYQDLAKTFFLTDLYRLVVSKNEELEKALSAIHDTLTSSRLFKIELYMLVLFFLEGLLFLVWFLSEVPH